MVKRTTFSVILIVFILGFSNIFFAQENQKAHDHTHHSYEHINSDVAENAIHDHIQSDQITTLAKLVTGQGEFIFSWDQELTAAFPKEAHEFEAGMHGSFNEDPETGIVYTGIPVY